MIVKGKRTNPRRKKKERDSESSSVKEIKENYC